MCRTEKRRKHALSEPPVRREQRLAVLGLLLLVGCGQAMDDQPNYEAFERSDFFENGLSSRSPVPGTVAREHLRTDEHLYQGKIDGEPVSTFPYPIDREMLQRGQERFNIFCSTCHDQAGTGEGMVVRRGFPHPPSYHTQRLRSAPVGHFFDVISNGYRRMPSFASRIRPEDRWAIVAYIRALQLSQHTQVSQLPASARQQLRDSEP